MSSDNPYHRVFDQALASPYGLELKLDRARSTYNIIRPMLKNHPVYSSLSVRLMTEDTIWLVKRTYDAEKE